MYIWTPYPFLRITFCFILGLLIARYQFIPSIPSEFKYALAPGCCLLIAYLTLSKTKYKSLLAGNLALVLIAIIAMLRYQDFQAINNPKHLLHCKEKLDTYIAKVSSAAAEKEKYFLYEIDISKAVINNKVEAREGRIHLYIKREDQTPRFNYGDRLLIHKTPFRIAPPSNPHEFNYAKHMADRNIHFQLFLAYDEVEMLDNQPEWQFLSSAYKLRQYFCDLMDRHVAGLQERAIAKALILGIKDGLDNQLKRSFSAAGAMHILAVSGLHVGIIIAMIGGILAPIRKRKTGEVIYICCSLVGLWFFALLTGMSPSVFRAAVMFSFMLIGKLGSHKPSIYNSLAAAALVLLLYNPNFLFAVGFQLSFMAVLGIVYIHPLLYDKLLFNNIIANYLWSLTCVSIAAQAATLPLAMYYFHQFPVYFLISNLFVILGAFIIMWTGIALLILGKTVLAPVLGDILNGIIWSVKRVVELVEQMDYSLVDWLLLTPSQVILLYLGMGCCLAFLHERKRPYLLLSIASCLLISTSATCSILQQHKERKLIFYNINGESVFDDIDGLNSQLITSSEVKNTERIKSRVEPNRLNNHLNKLSDDPIRQLAPTQQSNLIHYRWRGKSFIFITSPLTKLSTSSKIKTDYLVVSNNAVSYIKPLTSIFEFKTLIIDSSNSYSTCYSLERSCKRMDINYHLIRKKGALTIQ